MIARVLGYAARFCGKSCKEGFKADREGGMNYGLHRINGVVALHREEWSMAACQCAYCGEKVEGEVPAHLRYKFQIPDPLTQSARDTLESCTK
jgi:hypothetical protein